MNKENLCQAKQHYNKGDSSEKSIKTSSHTKAVTKEIQTNGANIVTKMALKGSDQNANACNLFEEQKYVQPCNKIAGRGKVFLESKQMSNCKISKVLITD